MAVAHHVKNATPKMRYPDSATADVKPTRVMTACVVTKRDRRKTVPATVAIFHGSPTVCDIRRNDTTNTTTRDIYHKDELRQCTR